MLAILHRVTQGLTAASNLDAPSLATWEYAGLMVTYWCNARCAFCYVYSGPDRGGAISTADALRLWRGLDDLAARNGKRMRLHLAGGEPTGDWVALVALIRAARDAGLSTLDMVETNAFWATDDDLTRARIELLHALGMQRLTISSDPYHQEFIPANRVQRCARIARRVLGGARVKVRRAAFAKSPTDLRRASREEKRAAFASAIRRHRDRMTGRAADRLAEFLPRVPADALIGERCETEILQSRHVHIDPYGNVFPGVCSGIILGNALETSVSSVWDDVAANWTHNPVLRAVVRGGSHALLREARGLGYQELPDGYAGKCHLCQHVRQFLVESGGWERWLGPRECYANPRDHAETRRWRGTSLPVLRAEAPAS